MPPKVAYNLTNFGKTMIPILAAPKNWGDENQNRLRTAILKQSENSQSDQ